jgi:hypothetical protein
MAKGDNAILPLFDDADHVTAAVAASSAVTAARFVAPVTGFQSGPALSASSPASDGGNLQVATCGAAAKALGVAAYDAPTPGDKVHIYTGRFIIGVTAGGTVTAGQEVESDSTGRAITLASGRPNGIAVSSATVGNVVYIRFS